MNRGLKAVAAILFALAALSGATASAASAAEFHSEVSSTRLEGNQTTANIFAITGTSIKLTCAVAVLTARQTGLTAAIATFHPEYHGAGGGKCEESPLGEMEVVTTGCNYVLNATSGAVEIECLNEKASNSRCLAAPSRSPAARP